ncbi:FkbM family methyltransferase [Ruegeria pomeroyi]|jgi:FkbM family methyltransferase|uniref:Methyltransferase, FkbM family n=2 Tax=Ruegeria pomeroyi TaxID=89184 RepID=Q5LRV3_RUEPO|nr:FkbM family methyltransferase [Ruegeria pomeroyi]HCE72472.1 FkbM family methyltransferase [Ruegeria sp.]AAV95293.1 methyltransferase, FkbM family [Ruegeria pomeroyi DSS-3]NVK95321.1 FkbM family methyltransferase [Ruegeria pomeroyi]NVL03426.1 FkbM family methyltransferase [Ruegeria pomeroyi]QWV08863.1 FkbM family methyltransferase [Ruegeria pomeroyi]
MSADGSEQTNQPSRAAQMLANRHGFLAAAIAPARPLRIADVGANPINVPDYDGLLRLGGCEVWGFEPDQASYDALMADPRPGTHYLQQAVGPTGPGRFHPHPQSGLGSLYPIRKRSVTFLGKPGWHREGIEPIEMELVALDDLDEGALPRPDLLKIDIQGGELDVIRTGRDKLSEAVCVIPEVRFYRIYEDEPLFGPLDVELHDQGFRFHTFQFTKSMQIMNSQRARLAGKAFRNQMMDGDAIYIRDPETVEDWRDEQLRQLAVASACVFASFDLTVFCLDELVRRGLAAPEVPGQFVDTLPTWMLKGS